jgi:hypothetical protein
MDDPKVWIAVYAAVVSTVAIAIQVYNWYNSGLKLHISLMVDAMVIGGDPDLEEKDLIIATVTNRSAVPTVITGFYLFQYISLKQRWRDRPARTVVVTNPQLIGYPPNVPSDLAPAKQWKGALRQRPDELGDMQTGEYYVVVQTSYRDKPYMKQIPKRKEKIH